MSSLAPPASSLNSGVTSASMSTSPSLSSLTRASSSFLTADLSSGAPGPSRDDSRASIADCLRVSEGTAAAPRRVMRGSGDRLRMRWRCGSLWRSSGSAAMASLMLWNPSRTYGSSPPRPPQPPWRPRSLRASFVRGWRRRHAPRTRARPVPPAAPRVAECCARAAPSPSRSARASPPSLPCAASRRAGAAAPRRRSRRAWSPPPPPSAAAPRPPPPP
mmetsp:Transcript_3684/g.12129  ORF Transcript_3684/g.12129 Transcript_3684/m.12129 type:complete len:218 (+) Transcript_3684:103-756(+)